MPRIAYIPPPIDFSDDRGRQIVSPMMANAQALMETFGTEIPRLRMQQDQIDTQKQQHADQLNMEQKRFDLSAQDQKDRQAATKKANDDAAIALRNRNEESTLTGLTMATTPGALPKGVKGPARAPVDKTHPTYRDWTAQAKARFPIPVDRRGHPIINDAQLADITARREAFIAEKQDAVEPPEKVGLTDSQRAEGRRNFNEVMNWPEDRREARGLNRAQLLRMDDLIRPGHVPLEESVDPAEMERALGVAPGHPASVAATSRPAPALPVLPAPTASAEPPPEVKAAKIAEPPSRYMAAYLANDVHKMQLLYDAMPDEVRMALGLAAPRAPLQREIMPAGPPPVVDIPQMGDGVPIANDDTGGLSMDLYNQLHGPGLRELTMPRGTR